MKTIRALKLTTHINTGGITTYIYRLIKPLQELGVETYVLSSGGEMTDEFINCGAVVRELPIRTKSELHPKLYLAIPKIIKIIRDEKIDIIHAHTRITQVMAFWIQKFVDIPVVTTCHGFYKSRLGRKILPAWGDKTIAISDGVADALFDQFKIPKEKIISIYNAVDIKFLEEAYQKHHPLDVRKKLGFGEKDPVIGVVARLVEDKGHEFLIRAIPELIKKLPNIRLLIVGDGRQKPFLENLVQNLGISQHVVFTGNLKDITYALAAMDLFILPATWREGFGLSIIEAMTCRKPVIVTNIWALNTLIQNRVSGLMIESSKVDSIVESVSELILDTTLGQKLSQAGRQMVEKLFSIDRMAREMNSAYRSLLEQRTRA